MNRAVTFVFHRRGVEPERVDPVGALRPGRRQLHVPAVANHGDHERLAPARADRVTNVPEVVGRDAVEADDHVTRLEPGRSCRRLGNDVADAPRGVGWDADHVDGGQEGDRKEEVRAGPGRDHRQALPRALSPVRVRAQRIRQVVKPAGGGSFRVRRQRRLLDCALELLQRRAGALEVALGDASLDPLDLREQARRLVQRRPEMHVHVGRRWSVHSRDLHVAAQRDRAHAVLDAVAGRLEHGGREPDVEAPRLHSDRPGREEVACLVDQDQEREARDRDQHAHATGRPLSASLRAVASASTSSSRSRAAAPSIPASVSSTVAAIPRNGSRPSRKAATATSFAALKAQG